MSPFGAPRLEVVEMNSLYAQWSFPFSVLLFFSEYAFSFAIVIKKTLAFLYRIMVWKRLGFGERIASSHIANRTLIKPIRVLTNSEVC